MNVQEAIRSIKRDDLIYEYAKIDTPRYVQFLRDDEDDKELEKLPYGVVKADYKKDLNELIDLLLSIAPKDKDEDGLRSIIIGYPYPPGSYYGDGMRHELVYADELLKYEERAHGYSYSLSDWDEILGYEVAETDFNKKHLPELMAQIVWEMTWYGFTPEAVKAALAEFDERVKEFRAKFDEEQQDSDEEDKTEQPYFEEAEEAYYRKMMSPDPPDEKLPEEERLEQQYEKASFAYDHYLWGKEVREVLSLLKAEQKG